MMTDVDAAPVSRLAYTRQDHDQEHRPLRRAKRRKYTPVACDECRRRKLKCIPGEANGSCQRCVAKGHENCNYDALRQDQRDGQGRQKRKQSPETVSALRKDVQTLRDTLSTWMASVKPAGLSVGGGDHQMERPDKAPAACPSLPASRPDSTISADGRVGSGSCRNISGTARPVSDARRSSRSVPEEPRFIGPTKATYGLKVGERALSRLGIPTFDIDPASGPESPAASPRQHSASLDETFWEQSNATNIVRLLTVFQEEVDSVYPCLGTDYLLDNVKEICRIAQRVDDPHQEIVDEEHSAVSLKDVHFARLAVATAIVLESHGKSEASTKMVETVERSVLNILKPSRELRDLQLLIALSIYYFHTDSDLLAWRTIGLAAREALVMGMHRKSTLMETFSQPEERNLAIRVFWTIYVLDRRWSFGTSLSFAIVDRDIDPELPEPGQDCVYLQCMVGYGRLCTSLWDVLVPSSQLKNDGDLDDTLAELDLRTQEWLESIPSEMQLRHPRLGLAQRPQPPVLQRLRALLYLRGNHSRLLIYRYYLLGLNRIRSSYRNAWLAVEIAQDSIQVLIHLNESTDIYRRQQAAFNYFLLSALAALFLAVCNDPETFAAPCKRSLHSAIDLLRHFSRQSWGSRRLWSNIRGIVPRLRRLEMKRASEQGQGQADASARDLAGGIDNLLSPGSGAPQPPSGMAVIHTPNTSSETYSIRPAQSEMTATTLEGSSLASGSVGLDMMHTAEGPYYKQPGADTTTPDFSEVGNELIGLFETFEQGQHLVSQADMTNFWANGIFAPASLSEDPGPMMWQANWSFQ